MAMPFVEGTTLQEVIRQRRARLRGEDFVPVHRLISLDDDAYLGTAARIMARAARALENIHAHRVVHRDIKPANILLDAHRAHGVYLCDLGLGRDLDVATPEQMRDGAGTPMYMAPERLLRARPTRCSATSTRWASPCSRPSPSAARSALPTACPWPASPPTSPTPSLAARPTSGRASPRTSPSSCRKPWCATRPIGTVPPRSWPPISTASSSAGAFAPAGRLRATTARAGAGPHRPVASAEHPSSSSRLAAWNWLRCRWEF